MKSRYTAALIIVITVAAVGGFVASWFAERDRQERLRYEKKQTELILSSPSGAVVHLFKAGNSLQAATEIEMPRDGRVWLAQGNYFLKVEQQGRSSFYPFPVFGYRAGPDRDGSFVVTVRSLPSRTPPPLVPNLPEFVYIPSGRFLLGDRQNPRETHYVWLTSFFISPCEVTNAEFKKFVDDPDGYAEDTNWTDEGKGWKSANHSQASAYLTPADAEFKRFGQPEQPVVGVTWFEANAFCRWLTGRIGGGEWAFTLPTDAEWEKAARGPDTFDYGLSMAISDEQVRLYNWKKNPGVPVTVVACQDASYGPNRYGLYHMSGNVAEWTQSIFRPYNREAPYTDDDRNLDTTPGRRTVRGGSWYSASTAPLHIPYRDAFQPEHGNNDLGFRIVARLRP